MYNNADKERKKQINKWISQNMNTWKIICGTKKVSDEELIKAGEDIMKSEFHELGFVMEIMQTTGIINIKKKSNSKENL